MEFVNIETEILDQITGRTIEFYELFDITVEQFRRGSVHVHGFYTDPAGKMKLYSDLIWGDSLDEAYFDQEGLLVFENLSYIYLGPAPFKLYQLNFVDRDGVKQQKFIPAESNVDLDIIARSIAGKNPYFTKRVNMDGTDYYDFQHENT